MPKKKKEDGVDPRLSRALVLGEKVKKINKVSKGARPLANHDDDRLLVPRVSTSLYGLDVATNGGWPVWRMSLIYGDAKGGKTTMLLRGMANMQRLCGNCYHPAEFESGVISLPDMETGELKEVKTMVIKSCPCGNPKDVISIWCDAEGVWLPSWARRIGVWDEKVILIRPSHGEQGYDIMTTFAETGAVDLLVVDSLAAMTPSAEMEAGMGESLVGHAARMNNRFVRKIISLLNLGFQRSTPMTIWAINQYRESVGKFAGRVLPGGKGQLFAGSIELEFAPGKIETDDEGEPILGEFRWVVRKNKVGTSGGKGTYKQWMSDTDLFSVGDLQEHEAVIEKAVAMGKVSHPNNVMYEFKDEKFRGIHAFIRYLAENPEVYNDLRTEMIAEKLHIGEDYD